MQCVCARVSNRVFCFHSMVSKQGSASPNLRSIVGVSHLLFNCHPGNVAHRTVVVYVMTYKMQ